MSFYQTVSNWLFGEYKVRGTQLSDSSILQHVVLVDTTGAYVAAGTSAASAVHAEGCKAVTASSTSILAAYSSRARCWVKNAGTADVYISASATATYNADPTLASPILEPGEEETFIGYTGQISGITASGTVNVRYREW